MKKNTPEKATHPVDAYFREQEAKIPVGAEDAHWTALQNMLQNSNRPGDVSNRNNAPEEHQGKPGTSGIRFITMLCIAILLCSTTWILVAYQQNLDRKAPVEALENGLFRVGNDIDAGIQEPGTPVENIIKEDELNHIKPLPSTTFQNQVKAVAQENIDSSKNSITAVPVDLPTDSLEVPIPKQKEAAPEKTKKKKHLIW